MTYEKPFLDALSLLNGVANVAGGYVSRADREKLQELNDLASPLREQEIEAMGWVKTGSGWSLRPHA